MSFDRDFPDWLNDLFGRVCSLFQMLNLHSGQIGSIMTRNWSYCCSRKLLGNSYKGCKDQHCDSKFLLFAPFQGHEVIKPKVIISWIHNVRKWPVPNVMKQLQCFIGFCNYNKDFISIHGSKPIAGLVLVLQYSLTEIYPSNICWSRWCQLTEAA